MPLAAARWEPDASPGAAAYSASSGKCVDARHVAGGSARGSGGAEPCAPCLPHPAPLRRTEPSAAAHLPARSVAAAASPSRRRQASPHLPAGGDPSASGTAATRPGAGADVCGCLAGPAAMKAQPVGGVL